MSSRSERLAEIEREQREIARLQNHIETLKNKGNKKPAVMRDNFVGRGDGVRHQSEDNMYDDDEEEDEEGPEEDHGAPDQERSKIAAAVMTGAKGMPSSREQLSTATEEEASQCQMRLPDQTSSGLTSNSKGSISSSALDTSETASVTELLALHDELTTLEPRLSSMRRGPDMANCGAGLSSMRRPDGVDGRQELQGPPPDKLLETAPGFGSEIHEALLASTSTSSGTGGSKALRPTSDGSPARKLLSKPIVYQPGGTTTSGLASANEKSAVTLGKTTGNDYGGSQHSDAAPPPPATSSPSPPLQDTPTGRVTRGRRNSSVVSTDPPFCTAREWSPGHDSDMRLQTFRPADSEPRFLDYAAAGSSSPPPGGDAFGGGHRLLPAETARHRSSVSTTASSLMRIARSSCVEIEPPDTLQNLEAPRKEKRNIDSDVPILTVTSSSSSGSGSSSSSASHVSASPKSSKSEDHLEVAEEAVGAAAADARATLRTSTASSAAVPKQSPRLEAVPASEDPSSPKWTSIEEARRSWQREKQQERERRYSEQLDQKELAQSHLPPAAVSSGSTSMASTSLPTGAQLAGLVRQERSGAVAFSVPFSAGALVGGSAAVVAGSSAAAWSSSAAADEGAPAGDGGSAAEAVAGGRAGGDRTSLRARRRSVSSDSVRRSNAHLTQNAHAKQTAANLQDEVVVVRRRPEPPYSVAQGLRHSRSRSPEKNPVVGSGLFGFGLVEAGQTSEAENKSKASIDDNRPCSDFVTTDEDANRRERELPTSGEEEQLQRAAVPAGAAPPAGAGTTSSKETLLLSSSRNLLQDTLSYSLDSSAVNLASCVPEALQDMRAGTTTCGGVREAATPSSNKGGKDLSPSPQPRQRTAFTGSYRSRVQQQGDSGEIYYVGEKTNVVSSKDFPPSERSCSHYSSPTEVVENSEKLLQSEQQSGGPLLEPDEKSRTRGASAHDPFGLEEGDGEQEHDDSPQPKIATRPSRNQMGQPRSELSADLPKLLGSSSLPESLETDFGNHEYFQPQPFSLLSSASSRLRSFKNAVEQHAADVEPASGASPTVVSVVTAKEEKGGVDSPHDTISGGEALSRSSDTKAMPGLNVTTTKPKTTEPGHVSASRSLSSSSSSVTVVPGGSILPSVQLPPSATAPSVTITSGGLSAALAAHQQQQALGSNRSSAASIVARSSTGSERGLQYSQSLGLLPTPVVGPLVGGAGKGISPAAASSISGGGLLHPTHHQSTSSSLLRGSWNQTPLLDSRKLNISVGGSSTPLSHLNSASEQQVGGLKNDPLGSLFRNSADRLKQILGGGATASSSAGASSSGRDPGGGGTAGAGVAGGASVTAGGPEVAPAGAVEAVPNAATEAAKTTFIYYNDELRSGKASYAANYPRSVNATPTDGAETVQGTGSGSEHVGANSKGSVQTVDLTETDPTNVVKVKDASSASVIYQRLLSTAHRKNSETGITAVDPHEDAGDHRADKSPVVRSSSSLLLPAAAANIGLKTAKPLAVKPTAKFSTAVADSVVRFEIDPDVKELNFQPRERGEEIADFDGAGRGVVRMAGSTTTQEKSGATNIEQEFHLSPPPEQLRAEIPSKQVEADVDHVVYSVTPTLPELEVEVAPAALATPASTSPVNFCVEERPRETQTQLLQRRPSREHQNLVEVPVEVVTNNPDDTVLDPEVLDEESERRRVRKMERMARKVEELRKRKEQETLERKKKWEAERRQRELARQGGGGAAGAAGSCSTTTSAAVVSSATTASGATPSKKQHHAASAASTNVNSSVSELEGSGTGSSAAGHLRRDVSGTEMKPVMASSASVVRMQADAGRGVSAANKEKPSNIPAPPGRSPTLRARRVLEQLPGTAGSPKKNPFLLGTPTPVVASPQPGRGVQGDQDLHGGYHEDAGGAPKHSKLIPPRSATPTSASSFQYDGGAAPAAPASSATTSDDISLRALLPSANKSATNGPQHRPLLPPKCREKSNRKLTRNAVLLLLQGEASRQLRETVLAQIDSVLNDERFVIVFRGMHKGRRDFRALYALRGNRWVRVAHLFGCPSVIADHMVERYYRFDTGARTFKEIEGASEISGAVDAVFLKQEFLPKARKQV